MQETLHNPEAGPEKSKVSIVAIAAAAAALLAVILIFWILFTPKIVHAPPPGTPAANLQMTPAEQEYVKSIQVGQIAMSRAENFIHQEVTILSGEVYNSGSQPVSSLQLTTTYNDELNQVVLKEARDVLGSPPRALGSGERRSFEISFDHVPNSWNMQQPSVVVTYLKLLRH